MYSLLRVSLYIFKKDFINFCFIIYIKKFRQNKLRWTSKYPSVNICQTFEKNTYLTIIKTTFELSANGQMDAVQRFKTYLLLPMLTCLDKIEKSTFPF